MILDPVIHGVAGHQLHPGHRFAHAALQNRIDVGQKKKLRVAIGVGNLRLEGSKNVQLGLVRLGLIQIFEIRAFPEEAFARRAFDAANIDVPSAKYGFLFGTKVLADNGDDAHIGKKTGGQSESTWQLRRGLRRIGLRGFQSNRMRRCRLR